MPSLHRLLFLALLAWPLAAADFVRDVKPIFDRACAACHGDAQQLGQLRLDAKESVFKGGLSGHPVVPGDLEKSELYRRVAGIGDQARMPMGGELPAEEIAIIREWIESGAEWPEGVGEESAEVAKHWAFVAPEKSPLPQVDDAAWAKNPIDRFVLAKLKEEGLKPSPQASKEKLLRRVHLDLTGLPPTLEEIDAFLADESPDAYEKVVDKLLASPHYGERWGRHWLDAARYADSDGFEKDKPRFVWFYRDWVVNALNRDLPYDQFVIEQIAGDLLPNPTQDQLVATGFLRNSMINEEGGIDPEQFRMEAMFDRMDALGKSVLGITIQCAQCHNHKFDPLTQAEYYQIFAFMNNAHESNVAVYTPEEQAQRAEIFSKTKMLEEGLRHRNPNWLERMEKWEAEVRDDQPDWDVLDLKVLGESGEKIIQLDDKSMLCQGYAPTRHTVSLAATIDAKDVAAFRLELLMSPLLPRNGPGRSMFGTTALTEFEVEAKPVGDEDAEPKKLKFKRATADVNPPLSEVDLFLFPDRDNKRRILGEVDFAIDGFQMSAWSTDSGPGTRNQPRKAVFELDKPLDMEGEVELTIKLHQRHGGFNSDDNQNLNLGRFRISATRAEGAEADPLPAHVRELLATPAARRSPEQNHAVFSYWRTTVPEWADVNRQVEELWAKHPEGSTQLILQERDDLRMTHRLERGDWLKRKEAVEPGTPRFLHAMEVEGEPDRLDFARWLVDEKAPTTSRSIVNRVWQAYFGDGLVETPEDLGTRAPDPSHPEMFDWLAADFVEQGWGLKRLHRMIVTSQTYRQDSKVSPELLERDPANRLLARGPRFRVEGEIVRDLALSASGLLSKKMGGPPVYPPAPDFLFLPPVSYGPKRWYVEEDEDRYRRSLYTFRYRSVPYPVLDTFDTPPGDASCVRRARSNTPLQALATLNETVFMEAARALAEKSYEAADSDADRLRNAFRRTLTRTPTKAESETLLSFLDEQRGRYASGELDPKDLLAADLGPRSADLAAWTALSRVLLNLDETITKE